MRLRLTFAVLAAVTLPVTVAPATVGAAAPTRICVALVVDFGDLGGGVHSTCAKVHKGATGYDVLSSGGHTFAICSNGVLGSIDGKPADGCSAKDDSVHFWSYWHRAPRSTRWTYSSEGGGTYQPANASTEGWHWMKSPPTDVSYTTICPPASPSPSASAAPRPSPVRHQGHASPAAPTAHPTSTAQAGTQHRRHRAHPTPGSAVTSAGATAQPSPAPSVAAATEPTGTASRSGFPAGLVAGIAAAVVLAGAATVRLRRKGGTS
ncbi:MAG: hypothetical protein JO222_10735 [Frankiales bacterium]|nr:hypothetical protein [Frankiales bacterium]